MAIVDLPEGEHQYKFCVDGQWTLDPTGVSDEVVHRYTKYHGRVLIPPGHADYYIIFVHVLSDSL